MIFGEAYDYTNFNSLDNEWIKYDGELKKDAKNGFGKLFLANGEYFEGEFVNDSIDGNGDFYRLKGGVITGEWNKGLLKKII